MSVASSSIETYHNIKSDGTTNAQRVQITLCLRDNDEPMTRREISKATGLEPGAVGGRVKELIEIEYLSDCAKRKCTVTGRLVKTVDLTERAKK